MSRGTDDLGNSNASATCGIFVTYQQNATEFARAVVAALSQVGAIVIVDNNTDQAARANVASLVDSLVNLNPVRTRPDRISLIQVGSNQGLSVAYNLAIKQAMIRGFRFVLLLDQDSVLLPGAVHELLRGYTSLSAGWSVGAVCCTNLERVAVSDNLLINTLDRVRKGLYRSDHRDSVLVESDDFVELPTFTNSGTLLPIRVFTVAGHFNESLFVDAIDFDYSLRLRDRSLRLFLSRKAKVVHRMGREVRQHVLGSEITVRFYPPARTYHIVKDTLTFGHQWARRFPRIVYGIVITMILGTIGALFLLPDRYRRCAQLLMALRDFGRG